MLCRTDDAIDRAREARCAAENNSSIRNASKRSMTPKEIRESLRISKQGAMDVLNPLLEAGLIQRSGTRKSGRYRLA